MEIFEYVAVLTSIIIGLGLARLLSGFTRLVQHPDQVRVYWVHLCWVMYMFLTAVFWWWWEFNLESVEVWTFSLYSFVLFYAVVVYLLCAFLFPSNFADYGGPKGYFFSKRKWFFGILVLVNITDLFDTLLKGTDYLVGLGPEYSLSTGLKILLAGGAMISKSERYHAAIAIAFLLLQVYVAIRWHYTAA